MNSLPAGERLLSGSESVNNRIETKETLFIKHFRDRISFENECRMYRMLENSGLTPALLDAGECSLTLEYVDGMTLSACLEKGILPDETLAVRLAEWFAAFADRTKNTAGEPAVLDDCNPRNFLLCGDRFAGFDFERWQNGTMEETLAAPFAMIRTMNLEEQRKDTIIRCMLDALKEEVSFDTSSLETAARERIREIEERRTMMKQIRSSACVILAGGRNSRMNGFPKGLLKTGAYTFMDRILHTVQVFDRIFISANTDDYDGFGCPVIRDLIPGHGPLGALHASLHTITADPVMLVPCDTPYLTQRTILRLFQALGPDIDAVVARCEGTVYPVIGLYRHRVLDTVTEQLSGDRYSMRYLLDHVQTVYCDLKDPEEVRNINTPDELKRFLML